ncbi:MAG: hypothetical protein WBA05_17965 [Gordonia sp. (in: high G+C Gram-positive bacteria)]|uniref:hypothetical protein n=1 Tax=Gordonia sp. (in: high G+C Gram-positive bacteria) TaxID=84139 RepID=UPI003C7252F1
MNTRGAILDFFAERGIFADDELMHDLVDECTGMDPASIGVYLDRRGFGGDAA